MQQIQLTEWSRSPSLPLGVEARRILEREFAARITTAGPDEFEVVPGGRIGTVRAGGVSVTVSPRFGIDRVLFMVAYANDPYTWREHVSCLASVTGLVDGMAALFARSCNGVLAQGLLHSYRRVDDESPMVKGRIRWDRQTRRIAPVPVAVRFDVHDDDIPENRILRETVRVLRDHVRGSAVSGQLARIWRLVSHLTPLRDPLAEVDRITFNRRNEHYRRILDLARTILAASMTDVQAGDVGVDGFVLTMHEVFEKFVRRAFQEALGADVLVPDLELDRRLTLDERGAVRLVPDLAVLADGRWAFVGDVKYKFDTDDHNPDLYQVLAYALAAGLSQASVIYAAGPRTATTHVVRRLGVELRISRLDLTAPPHEVLARLTDLARASRDAAADRRLPVVQGQFSQPQPSPLRSRS